HQHHEGPLPRRPKTVTRSLHRSAVAGRTAMSTSPSIRLDGTGEGARERAPSLGISRSSVRRQEVPVERPVGHVATELDADGARVAEVEPGPDAGIDDLAIEI